MCLTGFPNKSAYGLNFLTLRKFSTWYHMTRYSVSGCSKCGTWVQSFVISNTSENLGSYSGSSFLRNKCQIYLLDFRITECLRTFSHKMEVWLIVKPSQNPWQQNDIGLVFLQVVPPMVGVATLLQFLNLSNNKLKSLPDEISKLAHLREICIAFNKFEDIPSCIYRIQNLEILIAENNQVPTFFFRKCCSVLAHTAASRPKFESPNVCRKC